MKFDEWWENQEKDNVQLDYKAQVLLTAFKGVARLAWDASRNCPKCGRDLKLLYCPACKLSDFNK